MRPPVRQRRGAAYRLLAVALAVPLLAAATRPPHDAVTATAVWKINTHLFAANVALADAMNDSMVTIPPYGEIGIAPAAMRALREAPAAYRAGVLAPDLFPDMYVGGWYIHSDLSDSERWIADDWIRHVWRKAREWPHADERNKVMAFAYGFLTHGAGDMFAHTWVNEKADGAWVSFWGKDRSTAFKHIVLEGYVGEHTPNTNLTLDVPPRFVNNVLIKDPDVRQHSRGVPHYKSWVSIYRALDPLLDRAKSEMNKTVGEDAPYVLKCTTNPIACAQKEFIETWRRDINSGLRAIVDSSESVGEIIMDGNTLGAFGAMTGWMTEWLPKMYGAHALGEGTAALSQFMQWVGQAFPLDSIVKAEVSQFLQQRFPEYWEIYKAAHNPSFYMEKPGFFPDGTKDSVKREMGVRLGSSTFEWRMFEPIYNSIVLSKLVLLDGTGLNELARRAGLSKPLFQPGESSNVMLGVFRSMTQSYQWRGEKMHATTQFGFCGVENMSPLPKDGLCGLPYRASAASMPNNTAPLGGPQGFVLWGHPEAREKVFQIIFKGFGAGPGTTDLKAVVDYPVATVGVRDGRRALRAASAQTELMREIVADIQWNVTGVMPRTPPATPAPRTTPARTPGGRPTPSSGAPNVAAITDWGNRCCAKDIAQLRAALNSLAATGRQLQNAAVLAQLGRRTSITQLAQRAAQMNAALDAFANTRDAASATAALGVISRHVELLAAIVAGTQ
ncbi:MAG: zinc dependent phospholipase C family protein [Gemmatimonadaceae bacterium]